MKSKVMTVVLAVLLAGSFGGTAFAQTVDWPGGPKGLFRQKLGGAKVRTFEGTVLSHDVACHCVVLKTGTGNLTLQDDYAKFEGDYNRAKGLKIGGEYKGNYKTVDYINYALDIEPAE